MFFFRRKENKDLDLSPLVADMHSHLIPGIDDGSPDMETSIQLLRGFEGLGYKKVITTPHILWEIYPNSSENILKGLDELRIAAKTAGLNIEIHAAAEYFIDEHFSGLLRSKTPLLPISGNKVLVEMSMVTANLSLQDILFEMQLQNYQPVLAHPERYIYMMRSKAFFETLKDSGCLFQLNLLSLTGHYGTAVKELAEYLYKNDYYDFAGTDLHGQKHLDGLQKLAGNKILRNLMDSDRLMNPEL